jgi:hypothetical protein
MIIKSRIPYIVCSLFMALSVFLTDSEWVKCQNISPDEFMDLDFGPVQAALKVNTREVQFQHLFVRPLSSSSFLLSSELSSNTSFPLGFAETPILSEEHFGVILRI